MENLNIDEKLKTVEAERKKLLKFYILSSLAIVVGLVIGIVIGAFLLGGMAIAIAGIVGATLGVGVFYLLTYKKTKNFRLYFKNQLVKVALEATFDTVIYEPTRCIDSEYIDSTRLVRMGNTYNGDDYIKASYKGVDFIQSDLKIQQITRHDKNTTVENYFVGKWMVFDFHKPFTEYVQIKEKAKFGKNNMATVRPKSEKVKMEDIQFNDEFSVYCTDQMTAFYLLTPQFIVALRELRDKTDGQLMVGFVDGCLHIAVNSGKNAMEFKLTQTIDEKVKERIVGELKVITNFVDMLALDKGNQMYKPDLKVAADITSETSGKKIGVEDIFEMKK